MLRDSECPKVATRRRRYKSPINLVFFFFFFKPRLVSSDDIRHDADDGLAVHASLADLAHCVRGGVGEPHRAAIPVLWTRIALHEIVFGQIRLRNILGDGDFDANLPVLLEALVRLHVSGIHVAVGHLSLHADLVLSSVVSGQVASHDNGFSANPFRHFRDDRDVSVPNRLDGSTHRVSLRRHLAIPPRRVHSRLLVLLRYRSDSRGHDLRHLEP